MIVQATNGRFFVDPFFFHPNWVVRCLETPELIYKGTHKGGPISWQTARKVLRPAGIKAKLAGEPRVDKEVVGCKLVDATIFPITLTGRIPPPSNCSADLDGDPGVSESHDILRFKK